MIGHIRDKGGSAVAKYVSTEFSFVGYVIQFIIPKNGLYKLEVWGAQGGNTYANETYNATGGLGGYACGYKKFKKGDLLYVVVGGQPQGNNNSEPGYNGGGRGKNRSEYNEHGSGGGGATHIALSNGTLKEIGYDEFVTNNKGLIVAGGGGGSASEKVSDDKVYWWKYNGGAGGGANGADNTGYAQAKGGTQTSAGANGGFGYGGGLDTGTYTSTSSAGGGGGFYGGGGNAGQWASGAGGSGWIDGVQTVFYKNVDYMPSMETGVNEGNGKATITFIAS